jgi:hypothetical protein
MNFKHKYKKYKQKYNYLVKSGSYNDIILIIHKWWKAVAEKDFMTLQQLMSPSLQVVTINKRHTSIKEFLKYIKHYNISCNYKLRDFIITSDGLNTIVTYLVDNEKETSNNNKIVNNALHSVVINNNKKIILWNNFSYI